MSDHLSVGVQTWGSAILLGRRMARDPSEFGLFDSGRPNGIRILDLGAGTGLMSILCRKLLDLHSATAHTVIGDEPVAVRDGGKEEGLVVATDFLPEVLDNLKICVDLNFPTPLTGTTTKLHKGSETGIHIAKLDWTTFPSFMQRRHCSNDPSASTATTSTPDRDEKDAREEDEDEEETSRFMYEPFDLVIASDCVYDPTHADLLRKVASWVLRLPDPKKGDRGGTFVRPLPHPPIPSHLAPITPLH